MGSRHIVTTLDGSQLNVSGANKQATALSEKAACEARLTLWQAGAQPFEPAPPVLRMNRAAARFTNSAPTVVSDLVATHPRLRPLAANPRECGTRKIVKAVACLGLKGSATRRHIFHRVESGLIFA